MACFYMVEEWDVWKQGTHMAFAPCFSTHRLCVSCWFLGLVGVYNEVCSVMVVGGGTQCRSDVGGRFLVHRVGGQAIRINSK